MNPATSRDIGGVRVSGSRRWSRAKTCSNKPKISRTGALHPPDHRQNVFGAQPQRRAGLRSQNSDGFLDPISDANKVRIEDQSDVTLRTRAGWQIAEQVGLTLEEKVSTTARGRSRSSRYRRPGTRRSAEHRRFGSRARTRRSRRQPRYRSTEALRKRPGPTDYRQYADSLNRPARSRGWLRPDLTAKINGPSTAQPPLGQRICQGKA